jgi:hypothetical protein
MMKKPNPLCFVLFLGLAMLATPLTASAENIDVTPASWDYGDVEIGTSSNMIFTITSVELMPLSVDIITIVDDATGSFFITSDVPPPAVTLFQGQSIDVTVEFTPSGLGMHSASLRIESDAEPPRTILFIPVQGTGVPEEPGPGEVMADLIEFFETSVDAGTLVGEGPGGSASGRLNAFRNMLNAANDLIVDENYAMACEQLLDAKNRVDGVHPPPDFVTGSARIVVEAMIVEVMAEIGCL